MPKSESVCATQSLASFAAEARFDDLPAPLVREAKLLVLDHIGCALSGTAVDKGRIAVELAQRLGGPPEATIIGQESKVSVTNAAFANGELFNALDWDPIPHTLPCVIAGTLALAEQKHASGAELIVAIAVAYEIASRMAEVLPGDLTPAPHGYGSSMFGAVAGAGRILRLDGDGMAHAFGIGGFAAPIPAMTRFEGTDPPIAMTKYISIGSVAQTAVTSALLANLGYTGDMTILDGPEGFWRLFGGDAQRWNPDRLISGLGDEWRAPPAWYKRYPCEVLIGVAAGRLVEIMRRNQLSPDEIDAIRFASLPVLANACHRATELTTHIDAQFSVPYALAVVAHGIPAGPAWQQESAMCDPAIARLMRRIEVEVHPDALNAEAMKRVTSVGELPSLLEVRARGEVFTVDGVEELRMTEEDIVGKFVSAASTVLTPHKVEEVWQSVLDLENVEDINLFMELLSP
jgi:2-methylcitrate dehydratase PrpD